MVTSEHDDDHSSSSLQPDGVGPGRVVDERVAVVLQAVVDEVVAHLLVVGHRKGAVPRQQRLQQPGLDDGTAHGRVG